MSEGWSRTEVEATVSDYFQMLDHELRELPFNKAEQRRALLPLLEKRSEQSVEFKRANISAILLELGFPFVAGYKPRSNYQQLLREVVEEGLASSPDLLRLAAEDAVRVPKVPSFDEILDALTSAPAARVLSEPGARRRPYPIRPNPLSVNYLELEARNRQLGLAGEQFALSFERARLSAAGLDHLAKGVEHVALTRGDGLGDDILSFEPSGVERFVEVKTTKYGAETPFFLTRNEVLVSDDADKRYSLYRIYDFRSEARLFALHGSLRTTCTMEPQSYSARVA